MSAGANIHHGAVDSAKLRFVATNRKKQTKSTVLQCGAKGRTSDSIAKDPAVPIPLLLLTIITRLLNV